VPVSNRALIILGGGVHSAEMAEIVERINRATPTWNLLGFLTPHTAQVGTERNGFPVLGTLEALERYPGAALVPDNEWPRELPIPRERLVSLIDPTVFVSRTAQIGAGCVFYPGCFIGLNARVGDLVFCLSGSIINHDDVLEDRVVLASGVTLAGSVHVEEGCYLGQSCTVRQRLRIGRGSLIGMGAVVVKDVASGSVMVGNPARPLDRT
jgi:sugar O-acyltransferase (sialic acid O-acetyltransferase NeuD family)